MHIMAVSVSDICDNAKLAREMSLLGNPFGQKSIRLSDFEFSEKVFKRSYSEKKRENRLFLNI
jgi:hypothetical protein